MSSSAGITEAILLIDLFFTSLTGLLCYEELQQQPILIISYELNYKI